MKHLRLLITCILIMLPSISQTSLNYIWPLHDGDIDASPVPVPAGIWLFLSVLIGLGLIRGRNA